VEERGDPKGDRPRLGGRLICADGQHIARVEPSAVQPHVAGRPNEVAERESAGAPGCEVVGQGEAGSDRKVVEAAARDAEILGQAMQIAAELQQLRRTRRCELGDEIHACCSDLR